MGQTLYTFSSMDGIAPLAWSPDGTRLGAVTDGANGQDAGINVTTRDAKTGKNVFTYENLGASALSIGWSPDGKRFQASSQTVKIWDAATGHVLVEYQPQTHLSTAIVPSTHANPQAQTNAQSGGNFVYSSSWSPDGKLIASSVDGGAYGYEIQVWNSQTGNLVYKLQPNANPTASDYISQVSWSPDGKYIALTVDGNVQVWSVATKSVVTKYAGGSFAWSPDGKDIVSTEDVNTVQVWTALTGKTIYTYKGHAGQGNNGPSTVAWSSDGRRIASGGSDVQVWDATTGEHVYVYKGHGNAQYTSIESIVWSPDSKYIASGDSVGPYGGHVRVWVAQ
jgi:WD40 repeat protein